MCISHYKVFSHSVVTTTLYYFQRLCLLHALITGTGGWGGVVWRSRDNCSARVALSGCCVHEEKQLATRKEFVRLQTTAKTSLAWPIAEDKDSCCAWISVRRCEHPGGHVCPRWICRCKMSVWTRAHLLERKGEMLCGVRQTRLSSVCHLAQHRSTSRGGHARRQTTVGSRDWTEAPNPGCGDSEPGLTPRCHRFSPDYETPACDDRRTPTILCTLKIFGVKT